MSEKKEKKEDKPVSGQYRKVEFDLWSAWHEFTIEYSALKGLSILGRENSRQYKEGFAKAWIYSTQFWLKIKNSFKATWNKIEENELLFLKTKFGDDQKKINDYIVGNNLIVSRYYNLMILIEKGFRDNKGKTKKYVPSDEDLYLVGEFMSQFIDVSGIGDIEFRFEKEEENMFKYG